MSRVGTLDYMPPEVGWREGQGRGGGSPLVAGPSAGLLRNSGPHAPACSCTQHHRAQHLRPSPTPRSCACRTALRPRLRHARRRPAPTAMAPPTGCPWTPGAAGCWPLSCSWARRRLRPTASESRSGVRVERWRVLGAAGLDGCERAARWMPHVPSYRRRDATYTRILKLEPSLPSHLSGARARLLMRAREPAWQLRHLPATHPHPASASAKQTKPATSSAAPWPRTRPSAPPCTSCCATPGCARTRWVRAWRRGGCLTPKPRVQPHYNHHS